MKKEEEYTTEALLHCKALEGYQIDFARAVLTKGRYTPAEAQRALDEFYGKGSAD